MRIIINYGTLLLIVFSSCKGKPSKDFKNSFDTLKYNVSNEFLIIDSSKLKHDAIEIVRVSKEQPVKVFFPNCGSSNIIFLYDSSSFSIRSKFQHYDSALYFKSDDAFDHIDRKPNFDFTTLNDGSYIVDMPNCEPQGFFQLRLSTKK